MLLTEDMAAPPPGKVYELWLQDETGTMKPAGLMTTAGDHKLLLKGDAAEGHRGRHHRRARGGFPDTRRASRSPCSTWQGRRHDAAGPDRVAVVGSGVAGLTAAHVLARRRQVTLYEADARLGGHADTHVVDGVAVDTGFIVHNERTYPHLLRLFDELGVADPGLRDVDVGARRRRSASSTPARSACPACSPRGATRCARRTSGCSRRSRASTGWPSACWRRAGRGDDETLRSFLERGGFSPLFRTHFMESLVACVWSCDPAVALDYPARYLFTFLQHHGMLGVFGSPQWRTVTGGSREYVERVAARLPDVRTGTKVTSVLETADGRRDHRRQRPGRHASTPS